MTLKLNLVVHGLDINPNDTWSLPERRDDLKKQVREVLIDSTSHTSMTVRADLEDMTILGKVNNSGKAPPVLVKLKNEEEAKHVLRFAYKLKKIREFRRVFVTPDLGIAAREKTENIVSGIKDENK